MIDPGTQSANTGGARLLVEPALGRSRIERDALGKAPESCQGLAVGSPVGRRRFRLEQITEFVGDRRDRPRATVGYRRQRGAQAGSIDDLEPLDQALEAPSGGLALRRPPIFKKCGDYGVYLRFR